MPLFADRNYSSAASDFLVQLKKAQPTLQAVQQQQFSEFLSHRVDRSLQNDFSKSKLAQQAYVYQTSPKESGFVNLIYLR